MQNQRIMTDARIRQPTGKPADRFAGTLPWSRKAAGASTVEYAFLIAVLVGVATASVRTIGEHTRGTFCQAMTAGVGGPVNEEYGLSTAFPPSHELTGCE
jgi:Flp pilus assembly pilin Flp